MADDERDGDADSDERGDVDPVETLLTALALKDETRTGWQLRGIDDPESVADHTWGVALCCLFYADRAAADDPTFDADRALRMAILHDLAEAETGDLPTRADPAAETVGPDEKRRRERAAIVDLLAPFDADGALSDLWEEYEARESPEARFVKDMDLVDVCLQAVRYEREGRYDPGESDHFEAYDNLDEFFATAEPRIRTAIGRELVEVARERYEAARDGR